MSTPPESTAPPPDRVGELRAEAARQGSVVEVFPLADPTAAALLQQARSREAAGQLDQAVQLLRQALEIVPRDASYWQYLAELNLQRQQYAAALEQAHHSYQLGPQVGALCYRNWLTVNHSLAAQGDQAGAAEAQHKADACTVRPRASL